MATAGSRRPRLVLNFVLRVQGSHGAGWRHRSSEIERVPTLDYYADLARTAERGVFDSLFLTDTLAASANPEDALQWPLDPVTILGAVAARTTHIGLIGTHSTTFNVPFNTARQFASLDHVSGGRAGWNVVTSSTDLAAPNYGLDVLPEHDERYRRAAEYLDVTIDLWNAWRADAVVADRAADRLVDTDGIRAVNHQGTYFSVRGPLNVPRSPQAVPLLAQAGSSESGRDLAARYADLVYVQQNDLDEAVRFRTDVRSRAAAYGRRPGAVVVAPGLIPFIGRSVREAQELQHELLDLHGTDRLLERVSTVIDRSLDGYALDGPFPVDLVSDARDTGQSKSLAYRIAEYTSTGTYTLREVLAWVDSGSFHRTIVGTPEDVADGIQHWFERGALDGVSVIPPVLPRSFEQFVDEVVPILQRRGLTESSYGEGTLRDRLGLPAPVSDESRFTGHFDTLPSVSQHVPTA
ncbi:NtaA/DmoA family FMN-dependent monooxygenase [Oerskovia jenensis]|uniref:FMN-dependent oxidoreductase (Nitrilotriacetate monooxygenase family) n=1 Tax=Oerskovia jenensis TaxID=162169 RepID=A0ABS2LEF4_9CELL|nr:NtaA/DmoA family FMN-dependent monooxygenase [Oerskovia jenensis]MBM7478815.1 FMN-dependent oxidoreductase (nitrilotriacetate monooxygenase family) [Oerskovia jenensis]